jgi:hypothetical protein
MVGAPKKGYNLRTLGPQRTFAKKWWALKVLISRVTEEFLRVLFRFVTKRVLVASSLLHTMHQTRCTTNEPVRKVCPICWCEFKGGLSMILDEEQYI